MRAAVRAWVTLTKYDPPPPASFKSAPMNLHYKNIGRTPTQQINVTAKFEFWAPPNPLPKLACPSEEGEWALIGTLQPDQDSSIPIWITAPLKQNEVDALV